METKRSEVAKARQKTPIAELRRLADRAETPQDFTGAVVASPGRLRAIAEIKKASPSAGVILADFDPAAIARGYHAAGAAAISVLTDESYFQGHLDHLRIVKDATPLPVLRKDFVVDEYQLVEARAAGADAVLLIAEVLGADGVAVLLPAARALGLGVLVEVHSEQSLRAVLEKLGQPGAHGYLLGINNRDLAVQKTDLHTTTRLAALLPSGCPFVSESGIATAADVALVRRAGAAAILVGESLLKQPDPGAALRALLA